MKKLKIFAVIIAFSMIFNISQNISFVKAQVQQNAVEEKNLLAHYDFESAGMTSIADIVFHQCKI